jgi:alpha-L-fucosidase
MPDGTIEQEQEDILREVALWNFANREAIYTVKPLPVIREDNVWYTQSNDGKYIYAAVLRQSPDDWKYGERKQFVLTHIEGGDSTRVSILGFNGELVEYKKEFDAASYVAPTPIGLVVSAVNGQRLYTNNRWPNAVVMRISGARFRAEGFARGKGKKSNIAGAE